MGLATSQVRLLSLTSRKADVELNMQIASKRKTMLTREATELSKKYYAKLQESTIRYSTSDGYRDITYDYLMGTTSSQFQKVIAPDNSSTSTTYKKVSDSMILTNEKGQIMLDETQAEAVANVIKLRLEQANSSNGKSSDGESRTWSTEVMTYNAISQYLTLLGKDDTSASKLWSAIFKDDDETDQTFLPEAAMKKILQEGYSNSQTVGIYSFKNTPDATDSSTFSDTVISQAGVTQSEIISVLKDYGSGSSKYLSIVLNGVGNGQFTEGDFYTLTGGNYIGKVGYATTKDTSGLYTVDSAALVEFANVCSYYGAIFSAAFAGAQKMSDDSSVQSIKSSSTQSDTKQYVLYSNVAGDLNITKNTDGSYSVEFENLQYKNAQDDETLQDGLKSGLYQLVNVTSNSTGATGKGQYYDYFVTQNYIVEQMDNSNKETITAWYNAERASLNEKESYWDSEVTALSTELSSINTEIESVKKLRDNAISQTFKWGGA